MTTHTPDRRRFARRIVAFFILALLLNALGIVLERAVEPVVRTELTLGAVNGGYSDAVAQRSYEDLRSEAPLSARAVLTAALAVLLFYAPVADFFRNRGQKPVASNPSCN